MNIVSLRVLKLIKLFFYSAISFRIALHAEPNGMKRTSLLLFTPRMVIYNYTCINYVYMSALISVTHRQDFIVGERSCTSNPLIWWRKYADSEMVCIACSLHYCKLVVYGKPLLKGKSVGFRRNYR